MFKKIILGLVLAIGATTLNAQENNFSASQSHDASYNDLAYSAPAFPVGEKMKGSISGKSVMFVFAPLYEEYNGYIAYFYYTKKGSSSKFYMDAQWKVYDAKGRYVGGFCFPSDDPKYEIYYNAKNSNRNVGVKIYGNWEEYLSGAYAP